MLTGRHSIIPIKQHVLKIWAHFKTILLTIIVPQHDTVIITYSESKDLIGIVHD